MLVEDAKQQKRLLKQLQQVKPSLRMEVSSYLDTSGAQAPLVTLRDRSFKTDKPADDWVRLKQMIYDFFLDVDAQVVPLVRFRGPDE